MSDLLSLRGVGEKTLAKLNALGIYDFDDLASFLPKDYIDLDSVTSLSQAEDGVFVLLRLRLVSVSKPYRRGKIMVLRAAGVTDEGEKVKLVWYNSAFVAKNLAADLCIKCYAKLKVDKGYELINPIYEIDNGEPGKLHGIKPIYPTRGYIPQATFAAIVESLLSNYEPKSIISSENASKYKLSELKPALLSAHKPQFMDEISAGRERIYIEELIKRIAAFRFCRERDKRTNFYIKADGVEKAERLLPYALTPSQKKAVEELCSALKSDKPLNAMLVGDVGSGKTAVAMLVTYFAVINGYQVAVMAPTEILARQHYNNFCKLFSPLNINVALLLGGAGQAEKRAAKLALACGDADIAIGTHAIISKGVEFRRLGLVIVDEQHRFGVAQRTALIDKGLAVDTLTLSATPIPRSLRLTMFGDIDVVNIERRFPSDNIKTAVVGKDKREAMLKYIADECKNGKQAYIVAPKIYDSEGIEGANAEKLYEETLAKFGSSVNVALMHGKLKSAQKEAIIDSFVRNETQILVSTTVIEVGIDIPNSSIMAIMDADRFGLATLHQLRGRIGRNGERAYCFLYTEKAQSELERLAIMTRETDGFAIAEKDYELRGAGDFLGESQSGKDAMRPSIAAMKLARKLSEEVDTLGNADLLERYVKQFELEKVTLS